MVEQYVLGPNVSMDETLFMHVVQTMDDLMEKTLNFRFVQFTIFVNIIREIAVGTILKNKIIFKRGNFFERFNLLR